MRPGERCPVTEFLRGECAHCRAVAARQAGAPLFGTVDERPGPVFTAMYPGECAACGGEIAEGDPIRGTTHGYVHEGCEP